jgi:hypothetical protein
LKKVALVAGKRVFILEDSSRHFYIEYELENVPLHKDYSCLLFMPVQYARIPLTVDPATVSPPESALCIVNEGEYVGVYSSGLDYIESLKKSFKKVVPYHDVIKKNISGNTHNVVLDFVQTEKEQLCLFSIVSPAGEISSNKVIKVSDNFQLEMERSIRAARLEKFIFFVNDSSIPQLEVFRNAGIEIREFSKDEVPIKGFVLPKELLAETQKRKLRQASLIIAVLVSLNLLVCILTLTFQSKTKELINMNMLMQNQIEHLKTTVSGVPAEYILTDSKISDLKHFMHSIEYFPESSDIKLTEIAYSQSGRKITITGNLTEDEIKSFKSLLKANKIETRFLSDGKVEVIFEW